MQGNCGNPKARLGRGPCFGSKGREGNPPGRIWLPLLRAPLFAAALLVFMPCFSELTMSILLYGPGTENLGVVLFNLQEYADRSSAAVVGTLLLIVVVVLRLAAGRLREVD